MPAINWYPGHMAKTRRMLLENLKMIDVVVEILDARAPEASRNPDFDDSLHGQGSQLCCSTRATWPTPTATEALDLANFERAEESRRRGVSAKRAARQRRLRSH